MNPVFADAQFFIALLNVRDAAHEKATRTAASLVKPILTTSAVLLEVGNAMSRHRHHRSLFVNWLDYMSSVPRFTVVDVDPDLFDRRFGLFKSRPDKQWSLTDCVSFVVMEEQSIAEALTADYHFEQAGFVALLK